MALVKCANCGVFFGDEGNSNLCNKCAKPKFKKAVMTGDTEHDKFANARAIVYDHPQVTPTELVEELEARGIEISIREVMKYVTDGRLTLVTVEGGSYCAACGRSISIGTMCKDCSKKLDKFRTPAPKKEPVAAKQKSGMHTTKK